MRQPLLRPSFTECGTVGQGWDREMRLEEWESHPGAAWCSQPLCLLSQIQGKAAKQQTEIAASQVHLDS